ncbi:DUF3152 domain-containing protein [Promicromonospora umidemergens]|uniref:DUF3152 domain-containing protein n=1 Tax=Promicromonospora umidemergens TaxID=629679 RepID=UPI0020A47086|nr:DUF3152 domain-containing protein [Promicromonospora umidemergens]
MSSPSFHRRTGRHATGGVPVGLGAEGVGAGRPAARSVKRRPAQNPRRSMIALSLCLAAGLGGGMAATMSTEPDASAAVVAGAVEDSLGVEAGDAVRSAYEAARSGDRTSPPAQALSSEATSEAASEADVASGTGPGVGAAGAEGLPEPAASGLPAPVASAPAGGSSPERSAPPSPGPSPSPSAGPTPEPGSGLIGSRFDVEQKLSGKLVVASGSRRAPADGKVWRVQITVEKGLPVDPEVFAESVLATLNDPRGWNAADGSTFAWTDSERYDARVVLASPDTTDELCLPLDTIGELSCGIEETAVLNFKRWATGSQAWESTSRYRQYLVNHEVGHVIGYRHDLCAGEGKHATIMVQQTTTTSGCIPEPWPVPDAG